MTTYFSRNYILHPIPDRDAENENKHEMAAAKLVMTTFTAKWYSTTCLTDISTTHNS